MAKESPKHSPESGQLVPQPHGGAIRRGSLPGNTPGTGRPPSAIRARLRGDFDERTQVLRDIADGVVTLRLREVCEHCGKEPSEPLEFEDILKSAISPQDRLRAIDMMAKYGFGAGMTADEVRQKLADTLAVIDDKCSADVAAMLSRELERIWRG